MAAASIEDLPRWARALLAGARVGRLGLLDDRDRPRVLPVTFAIVTGRIWTAVDHKPKRVAPRELARLRWLARSPQAALTVDRWDEDWERLAWVQALGRVEIVDDAGEARPIVAALADKYAQYRSAPPSGPLLRLTPERVLGWRAAD